MTEQLMPRVLRGLLGSVAALVIVGSGVLISAFFVCVVGPWANQWLGWSDPGRAGAAAFGLLILATVIAACGYTWAVGD